MSNEKCTLPTGSYKISKKGYEEIYIPAVKHKSTKDKIVKIEELPTWA
jgi:pre-mRNA-splicing helicase BRR2